MAIRSVLFLTTVAFLSALVGVAAGGWLVAAHYEGKTSWLGQAVHADMDGISGNVPTDFIRASETILPSVV